MILPHEHQDNLNRYNELQEIKLTRLLTDEEDEEYENLYSKILAYSENN